MTQNAMCDGLWCETSRGEVRVLPYMGGNVILCRACFDHEIAWRKDRNKDLAEDARYDIPTWESLEVYGGAK